MSKLKHVVHNLTRRTLSMLETYVLISQCGQLMEKGCGDRCVRWCWGETVSENELLPQGSALHMFYLNYRYTFYLNYPYTFYLNYPYKNVEKHFQLPFKVFHHEFKYLQRASLCNI